MNYPAITIAKWFVAYADADEADISNLKIQKLLYYAQGHYLARFNVPLFTESIQAWSHGPVVPSVYHEFKSFGSQDVQLKEQDDFTFQDVNDATTILLLDVWEAYAKFSAWGLRNMTHSEPTWKESFDGNRNVEIPVEQIKNYFDSLLVRDIPLK
jgi:uncharacterized phage-associated protein